MIKVEHLTKRYGRTTAVDDLSFEVAEGEIVGFLGPNGAGKTTTMRILSGYMPATGGTAIVAGLDVFSDSLEVRRRIGYLPESVPLYTDMRVNEYLKYRGRIKGLRGKRLRTRLDEVVSLCGLGDVRRRIIGHLSKGYSQRVGIADSLIHNPEVLILDEPTIGLDPNQIRQIRNLIKGLAGQHTVLLSSHILPEVEMTCNRVLIINKGKIIASDTPGNLIGIGASNPRIIAEIKGPCDAVLSKLRAMKGVLGVKQDSAGEWTRYICDYEKGSDTRAAIFAIVSANGWMLRELKEDKRNLEDVFVSLTTSESSGGETGRQ
jgi:ABC-2 type transport system ATP-binding protein